MDSFLKIVYENGDRQSTISLFGISMDTIFTVLTTLFVFFLGYVINRFLEKRKEIKRLAEVKEYFVKLIELLESPLVRQKNALIDLNRQLKNPKDISFKIGSVAGFQVELLKSTDTKDLYKIFIAGQKNIPFHTQLFQTLLDRIEYVDAVKRAIIEFEKFALRIEKYSTIYNENLKIINSLIDEMIINHTAQNLKNSDDEYLANIVYLRNSWIEIGDNYKNRDASFKCFIEPILRFCREKNNEPRSALFLKYSLECVMAEKNIENVKYKWREDVITYARGLQTSLFCIKDALIKAETGIA